MKAMRNGFKNILVPVYNNINTDVVVNRAIEYCDADAAHIHLLYVKEKKSFFSRFFGSNLSMINQKLETIQQKIQTTSPAVGISVVQQEELILGEAVAAKAKEQEADLIVVEENEESEWFSFNHKKLATTIAQTAGTTVLTAKPKCTNVSLKTIILPVDDTISNDTLETVALISKKFPIQVHLLSYDGNSNETTDFAPIAVMKAYQWLKTFIQCPVHYVVLHGFNKIKAIEKHVQQIKTDVIWTSCSNEAGKTSGVKHSFK